MTTIDLDSIGVNETAVLRPKRRHPDWIRARIPSGENYERLN